MTDPLAAALSALKGTYDGFDVRFSRIDVEVDGKGVTLEGHFYYPSFRAGVPDIDLFVDYIYWRIMPFCLPSSYRSEMEDKYQETNDDRYRMVPMDKARNLFVNAKNSAGTTGEPGELILFIMLEAILGAPRVACKMYLKTSEQVPVHGSDAVHLRAHPLGSGIELIWGESKLKSQLSSALDDACDSLRDFLSDANGRTKRDRDIELLLDHFDLNDQEGSRALLDYFDPYKQESNGLSESFAVFVGFDFAAYNGLSSKNVDERDAYFRNEFRERVTTAVPLFAEKAKAKGIGHLTFHVFLMPFPDVSVLRAKFLSRVGVS